MDYHQKSRAITRLMIGQQARQYALTIVVFAAAFTAMAASLIVADHKYSRMDLMQQEAGR